MYYKRNAVDGRMQAAGAGAYNPGGLEGEVKARSFQFGDVNVKPISDGSKGIEIPEEVKRIRAGQAHYAATVPHGVPVHLMHGSRQLYLYRGIWAGLLTAMTYQVYTIYKQAYDLK